MRSVSSSCWVSSHEEVRFYCSGFHRHILQKSASFVRCLTGCPECLGVRQDGEGQIAKFVGSFIHATRPSVQAEHAPLPTPALSPISDALADYPLNGRPDLVVPPGFAATADEVRIGCFLVLAHVNSGIVRPMPRTTSSRAHSGSFQLSNPDKARPAPNRGTAADSAQAKSYRSRL